MWDDRWSHRDDGRRDHDRDRPERGTDPRERERDEDRRDTWSRPQPGLDRLDDERAIVRYRGHDYRLNKDDVALLRDVGTFRAVYAEHLRDEHTSLDYRVRQLREQDLLTVERIQTPDGHRLRDVLTFTRDGQRLLTAAEDADQRYHRGLVQPRELHHDAHLYRLVRQEEERLAERGARVERVQLDDELRGRWWSRELADLELEERAEMLGVGLDERGHVLFPDAQLTILEADDSRSRCNIELVTSHYSGASIRARPQPGSACFGWRTATPAVAAVITTATCGHGSSACEEAMDGSALMSFGFTARESKWLEHVLLHAGVFLRRQYLDFIGPRMRGAVDQGFLTHLRASRHVTVVPYHRRELVYHLTGKPLYEQIGHPDLRHRRPLPPNRLAQKLMLLDFTLQERHHRWLATEPDKVRCFLDRGVAIDTLPRRVYQSAVDQADRTTRYFVDRFPIFITSEDRVGFVFPGFSGDPDAARTPVRRCAP